MSVEPRAIARTVLAAALAAVAADVDIRRHVRRDGAWLRVDGEAYDLAAYRRIVAVGAGKASGLMAQSVEALLGDRLAGGLVIVKDGHSVPTTRIILREAAHPLPDARGVAATAELLGWLDELRADDLLLLLRSGAGSAAIEHPPPGL